MPQVEEPCLVSAENESLRERIRAAIGSQTKTNVNVLSSLHAVLDDLGYIPKEAIEEVADRMDTTINEVWVSRLSILTSGSRRRVIISWRYVGDRPAICLARLRYSMRCKTSLDLRMKARLRTTELV